MPKMMKILGLFLGLIYLSLTPLSAGASDLHTAAKKGDIATITSLLDKGADIEARDIKGERPIDVAKAPTLYTFSIDMAKDEGFQRLKRLVVSN